MLVAWKCALIAALGFALLGRADNACYWRSNSFVNRTEPGNWFACNNTSLSLGGAQLCCLDNLGPNVPVDSHSQCGNDRLCREPNPDLSGDYLYYVGGCTDPTYTDSVCRQDCTSNSQTFIEWDTTVQEWRCCGDYPCTGTPTDETFQAPRPQNFVAVDSAPTSSSSSKTSPSTGPAMSASSRSGNRHNGLSTAAIAGIAVAVGVVGLVAASVTAVFCWRRRTANLQQGSYDHPVEKEGSLPTQEMPVGGWDSSGELEAPRVPQEMRVDGHGNTHEIEAPRIPQEMPNGSYNGMPEPDASEGCKVSNWLVNHTTAIPNDETKYVQHEKDLSAIVPKSKAPLRAFLERPSHFLFLRLWQKNKAAGIPNDGEEAFQDENVHYTSDLRIDMFVAGIITVLGLLMLIVPLWILAFVPRMVYQLAIITLFVVVFLCFVSFTTGARPFESLGAAAAYAAVLVVFLQVGSQ